MVLKQWLESLYFFSLDRGGAAAPLFFTVLLSELTKSPAGHGGGVGGACAQCSFRSFSVVTFLPRYPEGEIVVLVYYPSLSCIIVLNCRLLKLWDYTYSFLMLRVDIFFRKVKGDHSIIFISSNAQNRHGFVALASISILSYAFACKAVNKLTKTKMTSDEHWFSVVSQIKQNALEKKHSSKWKCSLLIFHISVEHNGFHLDLTGSATSSFLTRVRPMFRIGLNYAGYSLSL